jgi:chemotaxis protein CheC
MDNTAPNNVDKLEPLQEVATIAAGNAATALAKLIGQDVTVTVPSVRLAAVEKILSEAGETANVSAVALVKITGDAHGLMLFTLNPNDAQDVTAGTIHQQTTSAFADQDQAVLKEMINIVSGAALNAIAKFLGLSLIPTVPASTTDMLSAVLDPFIAEFGASFEGVLLLQEVFTLPSQGVSLKFLVIIDPPSTDKMLQKINEKVHGGYTASH